MSAGSFDIVTYETNEGFFVPIRMQPESQTLTLNGVANAAPTEPTQAGLPSAQVNRGRRSIGINARTVSFKFSGAAAGGYKPDSPLRLPVPDPAVWAVYSRGQTGTYLSADVVCLGKSEEKVN